MANLYAVVTFFGGCRLLTIENDDVSMMIVLRLVYGSYEWQICTQLLRFLAAVGYYRK